MTMQSNISFMVQQSVRRIVGESDQNIAYEHFRNRHIFILVKPGRIHVETLGHRMAEIWNNCYKSLRDSKKHLLKSKYPNIVADIDRIYQIKQVVARWLCSQCKPITPGLKAGKTNKVREELWRGGYSRQ